MPFPTTVKGSQVRDATIQRVDVDVSTVGQALIRKVAVARGGLVLSSDGADAGTGDVTLKGEGLFNASGAGSQAIGGATDTYLPGSGITVPAGDVLAGCCYHCLTHVSKTAFGSVAGQLVFRIGTLGAIGDLAVYTMALPAGTAVADTGLMDFYAIFTTPFQASTQIIAIVNLQHNLTTTGLWNLGAVNGFVGSLAQPAAFNAASATKLGMSYHGGASAAHTVTVLKTELLYP